MPLLRSRVIPAALLLSLAGGFAAVRAQEPEVDDQLTATRRLFSPLGPGLRALRRGLDGTYYVLTSSGAGLVVFDSRGKQLAVIGAAAPEPAGSSAGRRATAAATDCDVASNGHIYIADRGNNLVEEFSRDGQSLGSIAVTAPLAVAALGDGQVAVATRDGARLLSVYDSGGKLVRAFGELELVASRPELNRYLSLGRLATDGHGHLYYGYTYLPEALVRQYDSAGVALAEFEFTGLGAWSEGRAARKEIDRLDQRLDPPSLEPVLTGFGVDPVQGDLWMCLHNTLLHFDKEGIRRSEYQIYTPNGSRLEGTVVVVEQDRLLIGADPLGVFEFPRPDKKQ